MNRFTKKIVVLGTACVMCLAALTGCGNSIDPDKVVAKVGDEEITLGAANFFARLQQASYETYYAGMMGTTGEDMWNQTDGSGASYQDTVKDGLMDNLTTMYVLRQHAGDYNISISDDEKKAMEKAAEDFLKSNNEEVLKALTADKETIEEVLELMTIQQKMNVPLMEEAEKAAEAAKESESETTESEVDAQAAIDYQYNEIITKWKDDVKVEIDDDLWNQVDFKKEGFTIKQQEESK